MRRDMLDLLVAEINIPGLADRDRLAEVLDGDGFFAVAIVDVPSRGERYVALGQATTAGHPSSAPMLVVAGCHPAKCPCGACKAVEEKLSKEGWTRGQLVTTKDVARFFGSRASGLGTDSPQNSTWAPAAVQSFAPVTISGDLDLVCGWSSDEDFPQNTYEWYDLSQVPVGGSIYRVSSTRTLWVFTRRSDDEWETTVVPDYGWAMTARGEEFGAILRGACIACEYFEENEGADTTPRGD